MEELRMLHTQCQIRGLENGWCSVPGLAGIGCALRGEIGCGSGGQTWAQCCNNRPISMNPETVSDIGGGSGNSCYGSVE